LEQENKEQHEESTIVLATNNKFIIHGFFYERREGHEAGQNIYGAPFHHVAFLNKKRA
jgi:hypothetical protein